MRTAVEGNPKAPFSIALTIILGGGGGGGRQSNPVKCNTGTYFIKLYANAVNSRRVLLFKRICAFSSRSYSLGRHFSEIFWPVACIP